MKIALRLLAAFLLFSVPVFGQTRITTPREQFGHNIGDDYFLANYKQLVEYWTKLDRESDRMTMVDIGKTAEGRTMYMAIVTSPENHGNLARFKEIARRLALAEGLTDDEARALASEGKAVVWIDGGLHANESLGAQQLIETVFQQVSRTDAETMRFLNDVILLAVCVNPDGLDLVANWYMRESDPTRRSLNGLPTLYQKYAGHDNNRDFYMSSLSETDAINRVLFREWFPQIVYNHHQTSPTGTVMFAPPFRDPFNFNYDPLIPVGIDMVAAAMHARFIAEGKPGVTMRSGANYSTWWNGGLRTSPYFHNQIGLLTETLGSPTPIDIPFVPARQLPDGDLPLPIGPQRWHFRQSIEYSITANRAVMDVASRNRDLFLFNIYRMGKNSIQRGSSDSWTVSPRRIQRLTEEIARDFPASRSASAAAPARYYETLKDPALRDPRAYIVPSDQPDFLTATKFINALIKNGIAIHRAAAPFTVERRTYPAGSFIVKTAQAFRPHILDMFEPQDHPDDFAYPGAPPTPPYDSAGWTLAYQMGVEFDRVLELVEGPFDKVTDEVKPAAGTITRAGGSGSPAGFLLSHQTNDSFIAVNRLLSSNEDVFWTTTEFMANGRTYPTGTHFIPARATTESKLERLASEVGLSFEATVETPRVDALRLRPVRIGLWDQYGGSEASGWTRLVLERFEFPFKLIYPNALDEGNLSQQFDVLILVNDGIRDLGCITDSEDLRYPREIPPEYRDRLGSMTLERTLPQLQKFLENGGSILAIGCSSRIGTHMGLPIADALVENLPSGIARPLPRTKFYIPGSVLQVRVDNNNPLAYGLDENLDVFYNDSPSFRLEAGAEGKGVRAVSWFEGVSPLRSGWAWGQSYLEKTVAVVEAGVGMGKLFLYGPEITFRSQPHGTFKLLFNGIYYGRAVTADLSE
jgi:hypothetical protein